MNASLTFKTTQTPYGEIHTMRIDGGETKLTQGSDFHLTATRPVKEYVAWVGPAYMAANGAYFRIGRNVAGGLIAWKTTKISKRFGLEQYRMRSVPGGYKGDYVKTWKRAFNGQTYTFSRIYWNAGKDGAVLRVYLGQTTELVHEFVIKTPVKMK